MTTQQLITPIKVIDTNTDYVVCVYDVKGMYHITLYDCVFRKNVMKFGKYLERVLAENKAREIAKQYTI